MFSVLKMFPVEATALGFLRVFLFFCYSENAFNMEIALVEKFCFEKTIISFFYRNLQFTKRLFAEL